MKSFLFLFLLSLRIPQSTFCQWRKNLRQLLSSIFVGVDSYQPRIKGVPGYDVSRLWVPSVWSVRTKIPSALLCFSLSPANISRLEIGKTCILVLAWSRLWFLRQPGRQTRNVSSEDYRTTLQYTLRWPGPTQSQCRRSKSESELSSSSVLVWYLSGPEGSNQSWK